MAGFQEVALQTRASGTTQRGDKRTCAHTTPEGHDNGTGGTLGCHADRGKYAWHPLTLHDLWEICLVVASIEETIPLSVPWQETFEFPEV